MKLDGKVAIVTGAGSGIGEATAMRFAEEGARLVVNDLNQDYLESTRSSLPGEGHETVAGDVSQEATAEQLARTARERFGRIDVLVNNAGIHFVRDITDTSSEDWDRVLAINLKSMFLCSKHVIPTMVEQRSGSIINLASISSFIGQEFGGTSTYLYNVTKAGALQLSTSLATRYAADGIRVNAVCPGPIEGRMMTSLEHGLGGAEARAAFLASLPLGRYGRVEEVAAMVAFLLSDQAAFSTGGTYLLDGGQTVG